MAYRVKTDGVIECDTAAEAIELQRLMTNSASPQRYAPKRLDIGQPIPRVEESWAEFLKELTAPARRVIEEIGKHPDGVTTNELAERTKIETTSLPPVLRSVRSAARKTGFSADVLICRERYLENGKPKSRYKPGSDLLMEFKRMSKA